MAEASDGVMPNGASDAASGGRDVVDILIIGGGPTGLFAAFYAGLRGATSKIVDSLEELGGQVTAMYPENPAVEFHRKQIYIVPAGISAAQMAPAVEGLASTEAAVHPALAATLLRAARAERDARAIPLRQRDADQLVALEMTLPAADSDRSDDRPFALVVAELTA